MFSVDHTTCGRLWALAAVVVCTVCASASGVTYTVGPTGGGACGGAGCDYQSVQAAIDGAIAGDTITVYRRTDDATNNECYDEHITINVANLTVQGASTTPASAACIGTSTAGDIVRITASGVTLKNFEISGKANDGAGGLNIKNKGGRHLGAGVRIYGNDIDGVIIENCTITFTMEENIRWQGDLDGDNNGNVIIRKCYLHHSDMPKDNIRIDGGSSITDVHLVEDNYMTTGQGIYSDAEYITVQKNIVLGYPYWAHLVSNGTWPETHDYNAQSATYGGGWRYFSRCDAGVWIANGGAGTDIQILNNLTIGTRIGIRVQTTGTINNNTVVNPFNVPPAYGYNSTIDATAIRDATYGIMLVSGFSGTLQNNIVVVTEDNRATGQPGQATPPYYTPGITGYGIGFSGGSGSLGTGASVRNNDVWGFVNTNGTTATNWGTGLTTCEDNTDTKCSDNISKDPLFATDTSDETNDGAGGCDADAANTRCYELYGDNFFLSTAGSGGSCHADIRPNTAAYVGFVDLTSTYDLAGLGACSTAADASTSDLIDAGTGAVSNEPGSNGGVPNLGAFGNSDRAGQSPTLQIVSITASPGSVKNGTEGFDGPGSIIPRVSGLTKVNIDFNRAISATSSSFQIRNACGSTDLTAPTFDFSGATSAPYRVILTWPASTFNDQWVRIHALGDGVNRIVDLNSEALDGEISDLVNGTLPSGNNTAGGDAQFMIGVLYGDVDGDRTVESSSAEDDRLAITGYAGYPGATCSDCPQDVDGDGDVDIQDRNDASGQDNDLLAVAGTCYDVSGIVYQSDGTTPITGKALSLVAVIDGATTYTAESNSADGTFLIVLIDGGAQSVITLYLDGEVEEANVVTIADGVTTVSGVSVIEDFLTIRSDDGANVTTIAHVANFDNDNDANEMLFTANGGSLLLEEDVGLRIESGSTFTPGGNVNVGSAGINSTIAIFGTWNATGTETINLEGDWALSGTFNAANGTVIFDGPNNGISTLTGATTFYNLTSITGGRTLTFPASTTTTVTSTLTLEGASNADLLLRSSSAGTPFTLSVGGSFQDNDGYAYLDYVDVKDCTAAGSAASFLALDSVDSTGNTSWIFNTITVDTTADTVDNTATSIKALFSSAADAVGDGAISLREALTAVANNDTVWFDTTTFPPATPATIDVDTSALPALDNDSVTIDASNAGVIVEDTDGDLANGDHGLSISGSTNVIKGLQIKRFDGGTATYGIYITGVGNTIGGTYNSGASNSLGDACQISLNYHGVFIDGVGADSNIIKGNLIGTDIAGTGDEGNTGYGIWVWKGDLNVFGSTTSGEENRIAFNGDATYPNGIWLESAAVDNTMRGNLVWDNFGTAISFEAGSNNDLAAPTIAFALPAQVNGAGSNGATVDVYTNTDEDTDCLVYVGSTTVSSGTWSLTGLSLTSGEYAVAIQTDASGDSSEVSSASQVVDYLVDTTVDENDGSCSDGDCSLRDALLLVADGQFIGFYTAVFPPGTPATIDVNTTPLPVLDNNNVTVNASKAGVIIEDTDGDLGNGDHGLDISGNSNTVMGLQIKNFDANNNTHGVNITGSSNTIGGIYNGSAANGLGQGCLISSNGRGIVIEGVAATSNTIRGCLIGTDLNGTAALGNTSDGIVFRNSASSNIVGGDRNAGYGNVISANGGYGIEMDGAGMDNYVIKGNYIGTDVNGTANLGNSSVGIHIIGGALSTTIGSTTSGEENRIAYNGGPGIELGTVASEFNTWRGNLIFDNSGIAIDISTAQANGSVDPPTIDTVTTGQVDGSAADPSAAVDVFSNIDGDSDCLTYVGSTMADGSGNWSLTGLSLTTAEYVVAIQTDSNGNSSEVSTAVVVP